MIAELDRRFPGLEVAATDNYDGLADAARIDPHVAYTERFDPRRFPREALFGQPSLQFVHASGAGINHLVPWDPDKISVCNAAGVQDEGMAQFAIARLIAMTCHFFRYHDQQKERVWRMHDPLRSTGGTLTVVGLGRIGGACARIARALGMTVFGVSHKVTLKSATAPDLRPTFPLTNTSHYHRDEWPVKRLVAGSRCPQA